MSDYYWREDILDVTDDAPSDQEVVWEGDEQMEIFRRAAEAIVEENGEDYYDVDYDEAVEEEMCDIIGLWAIDTDSKLYDLLLEWYDNSVDKMMKSVRDSFYWENYLMFVTGCGYAIWSADLLGGSADGRAEQEFNDFVRERA